MGMVAIREEAFGKRRDGADALKARAAMAAELLESLGASLVMPAGHAYRFNRHQELTWNAGGPGTSVAAFVERSPGDPAAADQLHVEIRVHLSDSSPKATLFADQGTRFMNGSRALLPPPACFLQADTFDGLRKQLAERFEAIVATFEPDASASPTP